MNNNVLCNNEWKCQVALSNGIFMPQFECVCLFFLMRILDLRHGLQNCASGAILQRHIYASLNLRQVGVFFRYSKPCFQLQQHTIAGTASRIPMYSNMRVHVQQAVKVGTAT